MLSSNFGANPIWMSPYRVVPWVDRSCWSVAFLWRSSRILSAIPETLYIIWKTGLPLLCTPKIAPASQNREEDKCPLENERPVLLIHSEMRAFEEIRVLHFLVGKTYRSLTQWDQLFRKTKHHAIDSFNIYVFVF